MMESDLISLSDIPSKCWRFVRLVRYRRRDDTQVIVVFITPYEPKNRRLNVIQPAPLISLLKGVISSKL
jgi:hypothetical protein